MPRLFPCRCFFFSSHGESFGSIDSSFSCKLINIDSDDRRLLSCCSGCRMSVKTSLWPMSSTKNHEKSSLVSFFYIFIDPHCLLKRVVSVLKMCSFSAFVGLRRYVVVFAGLSSVLLYRIGSVASILGVAVRQVLVVVGFGCWSWSWLLWLGDDVTEFWVRAFVYLYGPFSLESHEFVWVGGGSSWIFAGLVLLLMWQELYSLGVFVVVNGAWEVALFVHILYNRIIWLYDCLAVDEA